MVQSSALEDIQTQNLGLLSLLFLDPELGPVFSCIFKPFALIIFKVLRQVFDECHNFLLVSFSKPLHIVNLSQFAVNVVFNPGVDLPFELHQLLKSGFHTCKQDLVLLAHVFIVDLITPNVTVPQFSHLSLEVFSQLL